MKIPLRQVLSTEDLAAKGFGTLYKQAFAEAPYYEDFELEWIHQNVWLPHGGQCVMVAEDEDGRVVGFACAHHALADTEGEVRDFLLGHASDIPACLSRTVYVSELAVSREYRRQGLGQGLVEACLEWGRRNGCRHFLMRTAREGSNSRGIFERLGASVVEGVVQRSSIPGAAEDRVYLLGML